MTTAASPPPCQQCERPAARRFQDYAFIPLATPGRFDLEVVEERWLCPRCARMARRALPSPGASSPGMSGPLLSRNELIGRLDTFFAESGAHEICARCHQQGTGCCPSSCRVMGSAGCDPTHPTGKTVFCATFLCSALLNAISELDPALGRSLQQSKKVLGNPEFHLYQLITRVPRAERETEIPLRLPERYPLPEGLDRGPDLRPSLLALAEEVLAIRRLWQKEEREEISPLSSCI